MPKSKEKRKGELLDRNSGDKVKKNVTKPKEKKAKKLKEKKAKNPKLSRVTVNIRKAKERADTMFIAYDNDTLPEFLERYKKELGNCGDFSIILKEGNNDKIIEKFDFSGKKDVYFRTKRNPKKGGSGSDEE